jgi:hypothetical protein
MESRATRRSTGTAYVFATLLSCSLIGSCGLDVSNINHSVILPKKKDVTFLMFL